MSLLSFFSLAVTSVIAMIEQHLFKSHRYHAVYCKAEKGK